MAQEINLEKEMREILDEYALQVSTATRQAVIDTAKETTRKVKKASPRNTKKYSQGWTYTVEAGTVDSSATVYGKRRTYLIAHLLENGHLMRNGRRGGQRQHIKPVEEWAIAEFERKIREEVENIQ